MTHKFFLLALFITVLSCSSNSSSKSETQINPITFEDFKEEISNINFETGINDIVLGGNVLGEPSYLGLDWRFRVIMPDVDFNNNNRPLVLNLHDHSSDDETHTTTWCFTEPGFENLDPIILSPYGGFITWPDPENQVRILALFEVLCIYLPIYTDKILVVGSGHGGIGAWYYAETRPDIFSAGIPLNCTYNLFSEGSNARLIETPIYTLFSENDTVNPLVDIQNWIDASVTIGSDITLELIDIPELQICKFESILRMNVSDWLVNHVWD